ncbi:MAG: GntR family transcriptional regulator [Rhodospirillales bacterium]
MTTPHLKSRTLEPLNDSVPFGERAYQALLRAIVSGRLQLGAPLPLESIASQFEISVTPVREALNRLEKDGVVLKVPYQGWQVRSFNDQEIRDLYEARIGLERFAVRLACARITAEEISWLEQHQLKGEGDLRSGDMDSYWAYNRDLHGAILRAAKNQELSSLMATLSLKIQMLTAATIRVAGRPSRAVREHRELIELVSAHRAADAEELIERHLSSALEDILRARLQPTE